MLNDEGKTVPDTNFMSSVHFQSKPSSSKSAFDFGSSSSTTPDGGSNSNIKVHEDYATTQPGPSTNPSFHKTKSHHSNSDTRSSAGDYIDPFAIIKMKTNVLDTMKKVSLTESSVTELNTKLNQKVFRLDSKHDAIIHSPSHQSRPTAAEREVQLD